MNVEFKKHIRRIYSEVKNGKIDKSHALELIRDFKRNADNGLSDIEPTKAVVGRYNLQQPHVYDHKVNDEYVLLGLTCLSLAIEKCIVEFPSVSQIHLQKLFFIKPIVIHANETIEVKAFIEEDVVKLNFGSIDSETKEIAAKVQYKPDLINPPTLSIVEKLSELTQLKSLAFIYDQNNSIQLGESYKVIDELYFSKNEGLAKVSVTNYKANSKYAINPRLLNSAFLFAGQLLGTNDSNESFIPFSINRISIFEKDVIGSCWTHVEVVKKNDELFIFDASYYDESGSAFAVLTGCSMKRVRNNEDQDNDVKVNSAVVDTLVQIGHDNSINQPTGTGLLKLIREFLVEQLGKISQKPWKLKKLSTNLMEIGVTSAELVSLTDDIAKELEIELFPTLLFEYPNIKELSLYFYKEYPKEFEKLLQREPNVIVPTQVELEKPLPNGQYDKRTDALTKETLKRDIHENVESGEIAIIGMHGLFAGSDSLDDFWDNIRSGKDLITEIPLDHWDYKPWFDPEKGAHNKTYCKWGSFIKDVDKFDSSFFNISPREANWMDPQLRLLLQSVYSTAEDAGYIQNFKSTDTGVFVGVCCHDYQEKIGELNLPVDPYIGTGNAQTMIANRVSFVFDLKGPSLSIDTACSSSLFAMHSACNAIRSGDCGMAVVAGVNLLLASTHYRYFSSMGALSASGRCHSFDDVADGYIPGEGIATMLLKPLEQAKADGDQIYGVIKGSAALHGGYTPSLTAPSVAGEENVIVKAWENSGVSPDKITYIEAHGTGTKLGDPIEINSLKRAFSRFTKQEKFCAVGSVKSNIGHTEGAAGIAGVIKVLLQMRNQEIPAMPFFQKLNPYIKLEGSSLYINHELKKWSVPEDELRIAAVTSLGIAGAYAHVVLEEYQQPAVVTGQRRSSSLYLIPISADDEDALSRVVEKFYNFLDPIKFDESDLGDISYAMQLKKEHMRNRIAIVTNSLKDLRFLLNKVVSKESNIENVFSSQLEEEDYFYNDKEVSRLIDDDNIDGIAKLWIDGCHIDWEMVSKVKHPKNIKLPPYPFKKSRHWIPEELSSNSQRGDSSLSHLGPLLHQNISNFESQRFTVSFNGKEFYLADHLVNGVPVLPGVVCLELARSAAEHSFSHCNKINIKNVTWIRPIVIVKDELQLLISLFEEEDYVRFEIEKHSLDSSEKHLYCQGRIEQDLQGGSPTMDIEILRNRCNSRLIDFRDCYDLFENIGVKYGSRLKVVQQVFVGESEVLGKIVLPESAERFWDGYMLHPTMMDGCLQVSFSLAIIEALDAKNQEGEDFKAVLPFAMKSLEIFEPCSKNMWVHIEYDFPNETVQKIDISLLSDTGVLCARIIGFSSRVLQGELLGTSSNLNEPKNNELKISRSANVVPRWRQIESPFINGIELSFSNSLLIATDELIKRSGYVGKVLAIDGSYTISDLKDSLALLGDFNHIILCIESPKSISAHDNSIIESQKVGVQYCLRLMKALLTNSHPKEILYWTVLTSQLTSPLGTSAINPIHAGMDGFIGSISKENFNWKSRIIDVDILDKSVFTRNFMTTFNESDGVLSFRESSWFIKELIELKVNFNSDSKFRKKGVYVIIGGAGGLGQVLSEYLISNFNAKIVWIGRRPIDSEISKKIDLLGSINNLPPYYLKADASSLSELKKATVDIEKNFGQINGVVHSALVLNDRSLQNMEESMFEEVYASKVQISLRMYQVFKNADLDFMLFFSSLNSFTKNPGQSNYTSGCTFKDSFGIWADSQLNYPVKVINWGYWGGVGVVASESYRSRLSNLGIESIQIEKAMLCLETVLSENLPQVAHIEVNRPLTELKNLPFDSRECLEILPMVQASVIDKFSNTKPSLNIDENLGSEKIESLNEEIALIENSLIEKAALTLNISERDIDVNTDLSEYGFDRVVLMTYLRSVSEEYNIPQESLTASDKISIRGLSKKVCDFSTANHKIY